MKAFQLPYYYCAVCKGKLLHELKVNENNISYIHYSHWPSDTPCTQEQKYFNIFLSRLTEDRD